jgi:hypothetical protein
MTQQVQIQTDIAGARALRKLIREGQTDTLGTIQQTGPAYTSPVIVAGPTEFPSASPEGLTASRTLRQLDGANWTDTGQPATVRVLSNGQQIAWPMGRHGLCVQDSAFWAVNIGMLDPASHPLSGHTEGIAAVLEQQDDGTLTITDKRLDFVRRDEAEIINDGTLIQLAYVSGTLTIVWAACAPHDDLKDLDPTP